MPNSAFRETNAAVWHIVMVRLRWGHLPTCAHIDRRSAEGKTLPEAIRCLKRYLARRIRRLPTQPPRIVLSP